ncbi:uncharacterized protein FIBRA_04695 [Fibroporia radiculosa]|uniref:2'-phosphotransferase n=1 Tax=Fibroporia radiculosa TaxID=599839 RepID=J4HWN9_9APHY|nr:uncharacterized protein FIBRA_04695 [Fibroporia radiculosa]CCM02592.1 predicted protein [Fibroporia radiculosa]
METTTPEGLQRDRKDIGTRAHRGRGGSDKLKGHPRDSPETRFSKTLSWILRHGAESEGLPMRADGYVRLTDLFMVNKMRGIDFSTLEKIVQNDNKRRYNLIREADQLSGSAEEIWWIRANQGHSLKTVAMELQPINSVADIPTGVAVHGTTRKAWKVICALNTSLYFEQYSVKNLGVLGEQGLSKMSRNHIHLAQGVPGSSVISGMRNSSQILVFVDVQKGIDAGIKFYLSANGVVLTEGDDRGFLGPQFFSRVEDSNREPLVGWEGIQVPLVSIPGFTR